MAWYGRENLEDLNCFWLVLMLYKRFRCTSYVYRWQTFDCYSCLFCLCKLLLSWRLFQMEDDWIRCNFLSKTSIKLVTKKWEFPIKAQAEINCILHLFIIQIVILQFQFGLFFFSSPQLLLMTDCPSKIYDNNSCQSYKTYYEESIINCKSDINCRKSFCMLEQSWRTCKDSTEFGDKNCPSSILE